MRRESVAKLGLALGLFVLAGVFRQLDRLAAIARSWPFARGRAGW